MKVVLVLLVLAQTAFAEPTTLRLKLRPSSGELVASRKPCGKVIQQELWKRVFNTPWVEIVNGMMRGASKNYQGDPFIGEYIFQQKTYAIEVTLPKSRRQRTTVVSFEIVYTMAIAEETCTEKWLGLGEQF